MKIKKIASRDAPPAESLAAYVDSIRLMANSASTDIEKSVTRLIKSLPSRHQILKAMDNTDKIILYDSVRYVWKKLTGNEVPDTPLSDKAKESTMEGCYWLCCPINLGNFGGLVAL